MKREILFRGKSVRDGQWIKGSLVDSSPMSVNIANFNGNGHIFTLVKSETVGQFTNMTNKNGAMFFEGDIYKIGAEIGYVCFKNGSFIWTGNNYPMTYKKLDHVSIIGNIFDNPELVAAQ